MMKMVQNNERGGNDSIRFFDDDDFIMMRMEFSIPMKMKGGRRSSVFPSSSSSVPKVFSLSMKNEIC